MPPPSCLPPLAEHMTVVASDGKSTKTNPWESYLPPLSSPYGLLSYYCRHYQRHNYPLHRPESSPVKVSLLLVPGHYSYLVGPDTSAKALPRSSSGCTGTPMELDDDMMASNGVIPKSSSGGSGHHHPSHDLLPGHHNHHHHGQDPTNNTTTTSMTSPDTPSLPSTTPG